MEEKPKYYIQFLGEKTRLDSGEFRYTALDGKHITQERYLKTFNNISELNEKEVEQILYGYMGLQHVMEEMNTMAKELLNKDVS